MAVWRDCVWILGMAEGGVDCQVNLTSLGQINLTINNKIQTKMES